MNLWIEIEATDNVGMDRLQVLIDRETFLILKGKDPYGLTWTVPPNPNARHRIRITAFDLAGNRTRARLVLRTANIQ